MRANKIARIFLFRHSAIVPINGISSGTIIPVAPKLDKIPFFFKIFRF